MSVHLSQEANEQLEQLLKLYPAASHPGTAVGVVNKLGEVLFLDATGVRDVETKTPMLKDTVFPIFSCTKVVCGIACMQAVERGLISLDEPLGHLAPELGNPQIVHESDDASVSTRPARRAIKPITLRHLLTHTAGYTYSWYNPHIKRWTEQNKAEEFTGNHLGMPIVNEPGSKFEYGINMDWAGVVLERAVGMDLDQWCKENIFQPLGLSDSSYNLADRPDLVERSSTMHAWDTENNTFSPRPHARMLVDPPFLSGGGGLLSTPTDFLTILATLLNRGVAPNGTRIYSEETAAQLFVNQMELMNVPDLGGLATNGSVETTDASKAASALTMLPGQRKGWGLSFMMNLDDVPGGRKALSAEWGGVANLFWLADPTTEIGVIIFNSVLPYGLPAFEKMEKDVQDILYRPGSLLRAVV